MIPGRALPDSGQPMSRALPGYHAPPIYATVTLGPIGYSCRLPMQKSGPMPRAIAGRLPFLWYIYILYRHPNMGEMRQFQTKYTKNKVQEYLLK